MTPTDIERYIADLPEEVQPILREVHTAVRAALPDGEERIRYGMPAVMYDERYAIHFAGWKRHVGLYPVGELPAALEKEVAPHRSKKDSVTFPYSRPVPYDLIERLVRTLARRQRERAA